MQLSSVNVLRSVIVWDPLSIVGSLTPSVCLAALSMCSSFRRYLLKLLPDPRSQFACIVSAVVALGLSIYWLVNTVQSKWLYGYTHPLQIVSFEPALSLPSFFSLGFFDEYSNVTGKYFKVLPLWTSVCSRISVPLMCTCQSDEVDCCWLLCSAYFVAELLDPPRIPLLAASTAAWLFVRTSTAANCTCVLPPTLKGLCFSIPTWHRRENLTALLPFS
jgi:hypothetical protein